MRATFRMLIALFLSLLLPLQAGAALARSVGMMAAHAVPTAARAVAADAGDSADVPSLAGANKPLLIAHAIGAPHQHRVHAHHEHLHLKKGAVPAKYPGAHKARHAKGQCSDCGKCCMTAAAAPPSFLPDHLQPGASRAAWLPSRARITAHVPDGPERPPRYLTA